MIVALINTNVQHTGYVLTFAKLFRNGNSGHLCTYVLGEGSAQYNCDPIYMVRMLSRV